MGVLNVTPDSFSDGGDAFDPGRAVRSGAGDGSRRRRPHRHRRRIHPPGAEPLRRDEEWRRLLPVLSRLRGRLRMPLSVDTYQADIARRALDEGAAIVNDISGLGYDPALGRVVAARGAALVLMHTRGRSARHVRRGALRRRGRRRGAGAAAAASSARSAAACRWDRLILDPGLGFAKQAAHSLAVLAALDAFAALGRPLLVGPSRKSFLTAATGGGRPPSATGRPPRR